MVGLSRCIELEMTIFGFVPKSSTYNKKADGGGASWEQRLLAWGALLLLLFNLAAVPAVGRSGWELQTTICTSQGPMTLGNDGKPHPLNPSHDHKAYCLFCLPLMQGGGIAPVSDIDTVLPSLSGRETTFPNHLCQIDHSALQATHPARAPPFA